MLTPAHQHPTGVVLPPQRRTALLAWLRETGAIAIEDDYDAEYRYDRAAVGALQGLDPDRVVYAGSASKTLAPALRLGWMVVPAALLDAVRHEKALSDQTTARIEQHAMADFIAPRRARPPPTAHARSATARAATRRSPHCATQLPDATVSGIAAGLHLTVTLAAPVDEAALRAECARRRVEISTISDYKPGAFAERPTLLLGYAQVPEPAIAAAVAELAAAVRAVDDRRLTASTPENVSYENRRGGSRPDRWASGRVGRIAARAWSRPATTGVRAWPYRDPFRNAGVARDVRRPPARLDDPRADQRAGAG